MCVYIYIYTLSLYPALPPLPSLAVVEEAINKHRRMFRQLHRIYVRCLDCICVKRFACLDCICLLIGRMFRQL